MVSELLVIFGFGIGIYLGEDLSKVDSTGGTFILIGIIGAITRTVLKDKK